MWRHNEAAIIIQRNLAGRHRGQMSMAKATLLSIRSLRKMVDLVMDGMLDHFIADQFSAHLDTYMDRLNYRSEQAAEHIQDLVLECEVMSSFQAVAQEQVEKELRRLEEERRRIEEERKRVENCIQMTKEEQYMRSFMEALRLEELRRIEEEKRRVQRIKEEREKAVRLTVQELVHAAIARETANRLEKKKAELEAAVFARVVAELVQRVTEEGSTSATSSIVAQHLLDLANQTSLVIAEAAERLAEDSISIVLSLFSDKYSMLTKEVNALVDEGHLIPAQPSNSFEEVNSLVNEMSSECLEIDDEEGGGEVRGLLGKPVTEVVGDVRGAAQYFLQGRYEAAIQDLEPALNLIQSRIEDAQKEDKDEAVLLKMAVVLSIMLLLKAKCLQALARFSDAKNLLEEVHAIRSETFEKNHYLVGEELWATAEWFRSQAQYHDADKFYCQVCNTAVEYHLF
jgi:tetratricopeptide (TPR) repeat protein